MKRRLSPFVIVALVGLAALLALLVYGVTTTGTDDSLDRALANGERPMAPALEFDRLGAEGRGSLAEHRGKVVVVNVWISWCKPCREESPLLERWHRKMARGDRGTVLGIDVLDVESDAKAFIEKYDLTYPMLRDREGESFDPLGVTGYPETFVVDPRGRIVAMRRGPVDERFMREHVEPLLERS